MNLAEKVADRVLGRKPVEQGQTQPVRSDTELMRAVTWQGSKKVAVEEVPRPLITHPKDVIVKVTACTICSGSDSHVYGGEIPGLKKGFALGHECCGVVFQKGDEVEKFKVGDRVVVAFDIACGKCNFCQRQEYVGCEKTNDSRVAEKFYGHAPAIFGYGDIMGGSVPGSQAEYVRVPFADCVCYPIPDDVPDSKALYLSDVMCTSLHACNLGEVQKGDSVAIWGLGPIGLCTAKWCQLRGARRIVACESVPERIALAKEKLGIEVIDRSNLSSKDLINAFLALEPHGFDACIECSGFRFPTTLSHQIQRTLSLETDTADIITECLYVCRPFGRISVIADYCGTMNGFPMGIVMMKHLTLRSGQCPCQKYFPEAMEAIHSGAFDPTFMVTHRIRLEDAPDAYDKLFHKKDGYIKMFIEV